MGPSDFHFLFAVGRRESAISDGHGGVDDPETDLRVDPPRAGSQSVTFGDPYRNRTGSDSGVFDLCSMQGDEMSLQIVRRVSHFGPKSTEAYGNLPKSTESVILTGS